MAAVLKAENVKYESGGEFQLHVPEFSVFQGKIVSIIGPNGSGKSTLLRVLSRLTSPSEGSVILNGQRMDVLSEKEISKQLAMLPQVNGSSIEMSVEELVAYGRYPHRRLFQGLTEKDYEVIHWALTVTGLEALKHRRVFSLSGGERQRAWIAMAIAQMPKVLLLDEPTTYLDIKHQLEVMDLVKTLNRLYGMTIVMVLHDMNQAAQFSDHLIVVKDGKINRQGKTEKIFTEEMFRSVFNISARIFEEKNTKFFIPIVER